MIIDVPSGWARDVNGEFRNEETAGSDCLRGGFDGRDLVTGRS